MIAWGYMVATCLAQPAPEQCFPLMNWELATTIETVVRERPPLFKGDETRERSIHQMVKLSWFEAKWRVDAVGDHDKSVGPFQRFGGSRDLLRDVRAATVEAHRQIAESFKVCWYLPPRQRLAVYARGKCSSARGRELSEIRMAGVVQ